MTKNIYLIMGASGSGKNYLASLLEEKYGHKRVISCTSRKPRQGEPSGAYHFMTREDIDNSADMIAVAEYCGNLYGAILSEVNESSLYIIEPEGVLLLKSVPCGVKPVKVIYLMSNESSVTDNMSSRGDSSDYVSERISNDMNHFRMASDLADLCLPYGDMHRACEVVQAFIEYCEGCA